MCYVGIMLLKSDETGCVTSQRLKKSLKYCKVVSGIHLSVVKHCVGQIMYDDVFRSLFSIFSVFVIVFSVFRHTISVSLAAYYNKFLINVCKF
jgi:hypothetical protein